MNREDFAMLNNDIIYLDNSATTFKPNSVIDGIHDYYRNYNANSHRGDYDISLRVDFMFEEVRRKVKDFINAKNVSEIVFTKGTTESLNMVVFGFMEKYLNEGDEVLLSKGEHASNVLPWMKLRDKKGIVIKYIDLDSNYEISIKDVLRSITDKTKVISLAHISNVIGDVRDIETIGNICLKKDILFVVDAAQSAGHLKIDVEKANISFLGFSSHKMLGPSGVGILYGKEELLKKMDGLTVGGGMNVDFNETEVISKESPWKFEAGTQNIEGIIGLGYAIDYLNNIGLDNIHEHELKLKSLLVSELEKVPNITIFNKNSKSGIVVFNINNVFSQDTAIFLNRFNICVRSGNHCTKLLKDEIGVTNTCRASFYLYNNEEDVMALVNALKRQDEVYDNLV